MSSTGEVWSLLEALESPREREAADVRTQLAELFAACKDAWLVAGFFDYQLATGSARVADLLAKAPPPHDRLLLDRAAELLRTQTPAAAAARTSVLALLAHIVRKQPTWLHRLPAHAVFRDLLHLLKRESRPVPLLSGLLLLITLLPMIPTLISPYFQDIFDVFGRLAAWDDRGNLDPLRDHLQLALYGLFQNLYAMFPCNFVDYLRREYGKRENEEVFAHTVRPMLESVRMHPLLITASKNSETDNSRWKKMEHHDVLVECRRFSSEGGHRSLFEDEGRFRSRCGTDVAALAAGSTSGRFRPGKSSSSTPNLTESLPVASAEPSSAAEISRLCESARPGSESWFSLSEACGNDGALSAPQTPLPIVGNAPSARSSAPARDASDPRQTPGKGDGGSPPEAAIEATPENTPVKDGKQRFNFPNSPAVRALNPKPVPARIVQQQYQIPPTSSSRSQPPSPLKKERSPFDRLRSADGADDRKDSLYAQSRLGKILYDRSQQTAEGSPSPAPSPRRQPPSSPVGKTAPRDCGSNSVPASGTTDWLLAKPTDPAENGEDRETADRESSKRGEPIALASESRSQNARFYCEEQWVEDDVCEEDRECVDKTHGLHMPRARLLVDMARRVADPSRFRGRHGRDPSARSPSEPDGDSSLSERVDDREDVETQTVEVWPLDYEHLFSDILTNVHSENAKSSADRPSAEEKFDSDGLSRRQIDKYINVPVDGSDSADRDSSDSRRLELLQLELLFEKHRREVHASRNRRLLGRSRKNRATEVQNAALRHQMSLLQKEIDDLRSQVTKQQQSVQHLEQHNQENIRYWQQQLRLANEELARERQEKERLFASLTQEQNSNNEISVDVQHLRATLFDVSQQLQRAIRKSELGERHVECIKQLQRELIMCGERDAKYKEILNALPSKRDAFVNRLTQQYKEQLANMQSLLSTQTSKTEYWQAREADLESVVSTKDSTIQELKKQLRLVKEEYSEKLKAVEEKYQSLKRINQRMEAHCLELLQRVPQSPQTLSRDLTSGFSPQSSPLSASLASSEGQGPVLPRMDEIRNLQVIVNAPETIEESTSNSVNNAIFEDDAH